MNPLENNDVQWEPTKHVGLLSFYDGSKRWYHCNSCNYFNDRLYHSKMHYERIHVKQGRSIPRKQKYADLNIVHVKVQKEATPPLEAEPEAREDPQTFLRCGDSQPDDSDQIQSRILASPDEFKFSVDAVEGRFLHVVDEQMVSSDHDVSDSLCDDLTTTETADSSILKSKTWLTNAAEIEFLRNLDSSNAVIFTFGDGCASSFPNTTVGSYVSFDTKSASYKHGPRLDSGGLYYRSDQEIKAMDEESLSSDESNVADQPHKFKREILDQTCSLDSNKYSPNLRYRRMCPASGNSGSLIASPPSVPLQISKIKQELEDTPQHHSSTLINTRRSVPRGSSHLSDTDICYSPVFTEKSILRSGTFVEDSISDKSDKFSTPKSSRMLLDTSPNPIVLSCQQTGARVHDYLSGREPSAFKCVNTLAKAKNTKV